MALGTNYRRNEGREDKAIRRRLAEYDRLVAAYRAEGMSEDEARRRAFEEAKRIK